jgi:glyoxylase I family protein
MRMCFYIGCVALLSAAPATAAGPQAPRERVSGIGGFFFRAQNPQALKDWYLVNLGVELTPQRPGQAPWRQEAGPTSFEPFPANTGYFGDPAKGWLLDFRVKDLDAMALQLRSAGIDVKVDPTAYPYGRFARLKDPEGNPIELWEPR